MSTFVVGVRLFGWKMRVSEPALRSAHRSESVGPNMPDRTFFLGSGADERGRGYAGLSGSAPPLLTDKLPPKGRAGL